MALPRFVPAHSGQDSVKEATNQWEYDDEDSLALSDEDVTESYAIYSALLQHEMPGWDLKRYAIEEWTKDLRGHPDEALCLKPPKEQEALYKEEFDDYLKKNRSRHRLESCFILDDYLVLSPEQDEHLEGLFSLPHPWSEDDRKMYHDIKAVFTVSEVGFNRDHTRAIVYVGHYCGMLCGGGTFHLLIKRDDKWEPDSEFRGAVCGWVS